MLYFPILLRIKRKPTWLSWAWLAKLAWYDTTCVWKPCIPLCERVLTATELWLGYLGPYQPHMWKYYKQNTLVIFAHKSVIVKQAVHFFLCRNSHSDCSSYTGDTHKSDKSQLFRSQAKPKYSQIEPLARNMWHWGLWCPILNPWQWSNH